MRERAVEGPATIQQACARCRVRKGSLCQDFLKPRVGCRGVQPSHGVLRRGDTIFCEGDRARYAYVVASGVVMAYKVMTDGRRLVTGFRFPGDAMGEDCPDVHSYSAEAAADATVCMYPHDALLALVEADPGLGRQVLKRAHESLSSARDQMLMLASMSARERVAHFLMRMSAAAARRGESATVLWLPLSRTLIGDHLGLTMETVSRTLTQFRRERLIAIRGSEIELCDLSALSKLAGLPPPNPVLELLPAV